MVKVKKQRYQREFKQAWTQFASFPGYQMIEGTYPEGLPETIGETFFSAMDQVNGLPVAQWTQADILAGLKLLHEQDKSVDQFDEQFPVVSSLLLFIASRSDNDLNMVPLRDALTAYQDELAKAAAADGHPRWQSSVAAELKKQSVDWAKQFVSSEEFKALSIAPAKARLLVLVLVGQAYEELQLTPEQWTAAAIEQLLTGYVVNEMAFEPADYDQLPDLLAAFLAVAQREDLLSDAVVAEVQTATEKVMDQVVIAGKDDANYSPAKTVLLKMKADGVDINDQKLAKKYLSEYDDAVQVQRVLDGEVAYPGTVYVPKSEVETRHHVQQTADYKWYQAVATRTHDEGLKTARELWVKPEQKSVRQAHNQAEVVDIIVNFYDVMYADYVETPKRWEADHVAAYLTQLAGQTKVATYTFTTQMLRTLFDQLADEKVLTKKTATALEQVCDRPYPRTAVAEKHEVHDLSKSRHGNKLLRRRKR